MLDAFGAQNCAIVEKWLARLEQALARPDSQNLNALFLSQSYWRDVLALTWNIQTLCGAEIIADVIAKRSKDVGLSNIHVELVGMPPRRVTRVGTENIEAFFIFEVNGGRGRGIVRLCSDPIDGGQYKAWTFLTALEELVGHEETTGEHRPTGQSYSRDSRGPNWLDQRQEQESYNDRDPTVLVVGGGQAGLAAAARLTQLGVDTLIIDKHKRIGDNWRKRYHTLTLHNQVHVNHMPYMPFPPTWPTYVPKDKLANWFEAYVDALELNYWPQTELVKGTYDDTSQHWTVTLRIQDGMERQLRPRDIVMATGVSGIANRPNIPTLDEFEGRVVHSSEYQDNNDCTETKAIVIGTGNSGHDIAQDLCSRGADVTMVQRSPTLVVNIEPSAQLPYGLYNEGPSLEDCDLITLSMPTPLVRKAHISYTEQSADLDKDLLDSLEKIGFKVDFGEDGTGWQFKYLTRGGGYYFNVGCSDMLIEGKIRLIQFDDIAGFITDGVRLTSGDMLTADLIVLSTGYRPQEELVEKLFGTAVAARVGPIWGFGDELELRNMYCRTGQPGLYFIAGSFAQCRINSKYLALQIKASYKDRYLISS
jgi:putative flavoprotein involved in K+ transport